jgi:hypothetical protein
MYTAAFTKRMGAALDATPDWTVEHRHRSSAGSWFATLMSKGVVAD